MPGWLTNWIQKHSEGKRWPLSMALLAALICLPSLDGGLGLDDYFHRAVIVQPEAFAEMLPDFPDIFSFAEDNPEKTAVAKSLGAAPWWMRLDFKGAFWRPVTAMTHWLDYQLWPQQPWLMHLQSIFWYAAAVFLAALLYRRFLGAVPAAVLAALMFAVDDAHAWPVGFLANRNILVAGVFGLACLLAHRRWREEGSTLSAWMAFWLFAAALLSAEAGLSTFGYLLAYALVLDRGSWRRRAAALLPYLMILVAWRIIWSMQDFGVRHIRLYSDPGDDPLGFVATVADYLPLLIAGLVQAVPADIFYLTTRLVPATWWVLFPAVLALLWALRPHLIKDRVAAFFFLGALFALIPSCATLPQNRVFFFPSLGAFALIARWLTAWRLESARPRLAKAAAAILVVSHLWVPVLVSPVASWRPLPPFFYGDYLTSYPDLEKAEGKNMVAVNHLFPIYQMYFILNLAVEDRPLPKTSHALTHAHTDLTVERRGPRELILRCAQTLPDYVTGELGRLSKEYQVGDEEDLEGFSIRILAVDDHGLPSEASFLFDDVLEHERYVWYHWRDGGFRHFTPPAVGETVLLPHEPFPFGFTPEDAYQVARGRLP